MYRLRCHHRAALVVMAVLSLLVSIGVAGLTPARVAAAGGPSSMVISEFDNPADWHVGDGVATISTVTSPRTSGTGALRINYDMSTNGDVAITPAGTPSELPGLPRQISMDIYGDLSWNVIYYEIHDSTGEILRYWLGNLDFTGWKTVTLNLDSAVPSSGRSGNLDKVLDLPGSFSQVVIWRNSGATKLLGTIYLDRLTYAYDPAPLTASTPIFVPSLGQTTNVALALTDQGTFNLRFVDEAGLTRTYTGASGGGTTWSANWNGRDDSNRVMAGSVRALLSVTRGSATQSVQWPYFAGLEARSPGQNAAQRGVNSFVDEIDTGDRATATAEVAQMEAGYVGMAREEFTWSQVEPAQSVYDWAKFDQAVELERAHGIAVLGKLAYGSPWDNTAPAGTPVSSAIFYPPSNLQDYVDYAVATVHRYKDRVHVWEIWNEENNAGAWEPAPDAVRYTQLLKATYSAIKAEDPTATVVLGGLSTGPDAGFLQGIKNNGGWGSFDVLAIHTYVSGPPDGSAFESWIAEAKSTVASYGTKPIWITEFGWSSSGSVSTSDQRQYLMRSYEIAAQDGVGGIDWFEMRNRGTNASDPYQNWGIINFDMSAKPAFGGFQCEAEALYAGNMPTCSSTVYAASTFVGLTPTRILDTRYGLGLSGAFISGFPRTFNVAGNLGGSLGTVVPSTAIAVTGNLTVTGSNSLGYVYLGPDHTSAPGSSTINFPSGDDRANGVAVPLDSNGALSAVFIGLSGRSTQLIFDVTGYFIPNTSGATYHALTPSRVLDTRNGTGGLSGPFSSHLARQFTVTGATSGVPANATSVTGNLTVTAQTSQGYLYIGPSAANNPTSSTLNFPVGDDRANGVTVALGSGGTLWVTYVGQASGQTAHVIFDVSGYFTPDGSGATYHPVTPSRILDTRNGTGGLSGAFGSHSARTFAVIGHGGVPASATAVTGNLTVTSQTSLGYLYVGPTAMNYPTSSTLNFPVGDDRANGVAVALGSGSLSVTFVAPAPGPIAQVIFDVTGYFAP